MDWGLIAQILSVPAALAAVFSNTRTESGTPNVWGWILITVALVGAIAIYNDNKENDKRFARLVGQVNSVEDIVTTTRNNIDDSKKLEERNRQVLNDTSKNVADLQNLSKNIKSQADVLKLESGRLINLTEYQLKRGAYSLIETKKNLIKSDNEYKVEGAGFSVELKDFGMKGGIQLAIEDDRRKNLVKSRYVVSGQPYQFDFGLYEYLVIPTRADATKKSVTVDIYRKQLYIDKELSNVLGIKAEK